MYKDFLHGKTEDITQWTNEKILTASENRIVKHNVKIIKLGPEVAKPEKCLK